MARRQLDFAGVNILVQRGAFGFVEFAIFVDVVLVEDFFGQSIRTWRRAHIFVRSQLAIAIFVQRLEDSDSISDFIGIEDAIMVGVQGPNDERWRRGTVAAARAWTTRWTGIWRRAVGILGEGEHPAGACANSAHEGKFGKCFHVFCLFVYVFVAADHRHLTGKQPALIQFRSGPRTHHGFEV